MRVLIALPILIPMTASAITLLTMRTGRLQRAVSIGASAATLAASVALLVRIEAEGVTAVGVGGWAPDVGIALVADLFACLLLVVSHIAIFSVLVYSVGHPRTRDSGTVFHPLYLAMTAGVSLAFLTGDLFNLFVAFEILLTASYALLTLGGRREQIRPAMTYIVISLVASLLFITAIGLIYAATGTVNLAKLAVELEQLPGDVRTALGLLLLVVFGTKAAVFPLFFWLPDSYPTAPSPVSAVFAGLLTKVGVYAIIRSQTLLFPRDEPWWLLSIVAGTTMFIGVLGAVAQQDMKRILSFHIVSQIGYMIMGVALFSVAGVAAAIFYLMHHIPVKTSLFLLEGIVEQTAGSSRLDRVSGIARSRPVVAALFMIVAMSLAGIPPLSGFIGKFALLQASVEDDQWIIVVVALVVSILTLFSMTKIWNAVFWGQPSTGLAPLASNVDSHRSMLAATAGLVMLTLAIAAGAGPLYDLSERAATDLLIRGPYLDAIFSL
ncbi:MAG: Na+/H+ antiporter subunit D [Actinobacteria bacterium]|nr:Na+/H+ antiporter subunit D [Actinomycetota bacterium]